MTEGEILEYAQKCGLESAANLLLLVGPDGFDGNRLWFSPPVCGFCYAIKAAFMGVKDKCIGYPSLSWMC